ncbi:glycosyl hydrolase, partial [Phytoactinopolyspora endophytica]|uniref:glycosyl hydrolase n=1 Tax=Phytoactinopolyspora endophytica TaxID=1642495 RepID=UPI00197BD4D5
PTGVARDKPNHDIAPKEWLERLFQLGGLDYMDALAIHTYNYPHEPADVTSHMNEIKDLIREYNDGELIPIWVTEQGWPTYTGPLGVTEATQARYVPQAHAVAMATGVERYFYYEFMNDVAQPDPAIRGENFGLVHNTDEPAGRWTPKPGYVTYAVTTRQLTGTEFDHIEQLGSGASSYVFNRANGDQTRMMWGDGNGQIRLTIQTTEPVTVTNLVGVSRTLTPHNGQVTMTLDRAPKYLTGSNLQVSVS